MLNTLVLDIETIPTQREDIRAFVASAVEPPGNISKAETIAAWNAEKRPAAVEEAVSKTGLDGAFGQACVIGFAVGDGAPAAVYTIDWQRPTAEAEMLAEFNDQLKKHIALSDEHAITVVGHNVSSFDLRFLMQRYIVNRVKPHSIIRRAAQAKPWESEKVFDTMVQFAGVGNRISLHKLCMALGLPGKGDIDGSMVWPMVRDGQILKVANYCKDDVTKTRDVFRRMTFAKEGV